MPTPRVVRRRRVIKAGLGLLAVSLMGAVVARIYLIRSSPPSPEQLAGFSDLEAQILNRVNAERVRADLKPLKFSPRLVVVARGHSRDMAMRRYLAHESPEGVGPAERMRGSGISFVAAAENIYVDDFRDLEGLAERTVDAWLKSAEHRAAMLSDRFVETGVGIGHSGDGKTYVTQDFVR